MPEQVPEIIWLHKPRWMTLGPAKINLVFTNRGRILAASRFIDYTFSPLGQGDFCYQAVTFKTPSSEHSCRDGQRSSRLMTAKNTRLGAPTQPVASRLNNRKARPAVLPKLTVAKVTVAFT